MFVGGVAMRWGLQFGEGLGRIALIGGAALAAYAALAVAAAHPAEASGRGSGGRRPPLTAVNTEDLRFGKLIAGGAATVSIDPATGQRTTSGAFGDPAMMFGPARFRIVGAPNREIVVYLPGAFSIGAGADVGSLRRDGPARLRLGPDGALYLNVGGSLTLSASHAFGPLSARFSIDVAYDDFDDDDDDDDDDDCDSKGRS